MFELNWLSIYIGGLIASQLLMGVTILWAPKMNVVSIALFAVLTVFWPIAWPACIVFGFTKFNESMFPNGK